MIGITADTNIYVSGPHFGGVPRHFLPAAISGAFHLDASEFLLDEGRDVLRTRFLWPSDRIVAALATLAGCTTIIRPFQTLTVIADDPDDDRILECAVAAGSAFIVTDDNHLLRLGSFDGIPMIRVADLLKILSP